MSRFLAYNFNENDTSTIRDYSQNGYDGTGTGLSNQNSSLVGKDIIFNALTDQIDCGTLTNLDGVVGFSMFLSLRIDSGSGTKNIISRSNQFDITYNYTTNQITCKVEVATGTVSVSASLSVDVFKTIAFSYNGTGSLYIDTTLEDTDATQSGVVDNGTGRIFVGDDSVNSSANMTVNEIILFDDHKSLANLNSLINEPNGVLVDTSISHSFNVGDIVAFDIFGSPKYAIISHTSGTEYRFYPVTSSIYGGLIGQRVGHLWDTTRQWSLRIDDTPNIIIYDNVSLSSEAFTDSKKVIALNRDGIVKNSVTKTANYTVVKSDQIIYVDTSGGVFTLTLEASPATNREIEVIDSAGSCASNNLTISGNGNNINGSANDTMSTNYGYFILKFNGSTWNRK